MSANEAAAEGCSSTGPNGVLIYTYLRGCTVFGAFVLLFTRLRS